MATRSFALALNPQLGRLGLALPPAPLTPGTFPGPTIINAPLTPDQDPVGTLTNVGCNLISNATLRAACIAAGSLIGGRQGSGGGSNATPNFQPCPTGYVPDGQGGCRISGMGGYLPGDVGRQDFGWQAVNGRYGAGHVPIEVPISRAVCPPGEKLGKDGVCYHSLRQSDRLWNPGTKPFLTGGQVNAIRTAKRLQRKFKRLQSGKNALFPAGARAPRKGKKR